VGGLDSGMGYFAIARKHCQHIDEAFWLPAELGPDHPAAAAHGFKGGGKRNGLPISDRGALLLAGQTVRLVRSKQRRRGQNNEKNGGCKHPGHGLRLTQDRVNRG